MLDSSIDYYRTVDPDCCQDCNHALAPAAFSTFTYLHAELPTDVRLVAVATSCFNGQKKLSAAVLADSEDDHILKLCV